MTKKTDIFVAIDTQSQENAKKLIGQLNNKHCGIKIGKELFTSCGPEIVQWVKSEGFEVFLDLKFHDIPNTVVKACGAAARMNVDIINVHSLGGKEMMSAAKNAVSNQQIKLIGVTLLTSHDINFMTEVGLSGSVDDCVKKLAINAAESGLDGIVCAAPDIPNIRQYLPNNFMFITPGIRLDKINNDDQKRAANPIDAVNFGSDILVIGRPITGDINPQEALLRLHNQLNN
jgi:orotidine-5'-phosphate decarboxylase